jgi:hypothetical protein
VKTKQYVIAYLVWTVAMIPMSLLTNGLTRAAKAYLDKHEDQTLVVLSSLPLVVAAINLVVGFFIFRFVTKRFILEYRS